MSSLGVRSPIQIGVIGIGAIATRLHIPELTALSDVTIQAVASRTREAGAAVAARYGISRVYDGDEGWRGLVDDPVIDAVLICTPNDLHADIAVGAARAGKHVLVEKPLARTVEEGRQILEAVRQAGVTCCVAHHRRLKPVYRDGRSLLAAGVVGDLYHVEAILGHAGPETWAPDAVWFFDQKRAGGGAVLDLGIHMVDVVLWLLGLVPTDVIGSLTTVEKPTSLEDQGVAVLRFESGCLATITVSWAMHPTVRRVEVFGSRGRLVLDEGAEDGIVLDVLRPTPVQQRWRFPLPTLNAAGSPINGAGPAFVETLRDGVPRLATGEEGLNALAVVEAWYRSARTRAACALTDIL